MTLPQSIFGGRAALKSPPSPFASPFSIAPKSGRVPSPFAAVEDASPFPSVVPESGKPARLPEKRRPEGSPIPFPNSPFAGVEPSRGFKFSVGAKPFKFRGFEPVFECSAPAAATPAHLSTAAPSAAEPAARSSKGAWSRLASSLRRDKPEVASEPTEVRQLELRALFGVDRELSAEEILQRAQALPGLRSLTRIGSQQVAGLESLRQGFSNLGFGSPEAIRLIQGGLSVEFIRQGDVVLAVQTDGGFVPGVRETLIIVARELNRMG